MRQHGLKYWRLKMTEGGTDMYSKGRSTIYFYSGTHWDREWYQTFQGFRYRLVGMMNELIDVLEADPELRVFHLDGQTIPLEDFMEIEPARREQLAKLIADKRIEVGPWYVMPDEMLLSGESLIRNLLRGHAVARSWGAEVWKFGNVCDVFGHIAQLPQILMGFGIPYAMLGRGTNEHSCPAHFRWQAPDGSELIAFKLPDAEGYASFYRLVISQLGEQGLDGDAAEKLIQSYIDHERSRSAIPVSLVMDSFDHESVHKDTPQYLNAIRRLYPDAEVKHVSLTEMGRQLESYREEMPIMKGELYEPAKVTASYIHLITHTLSSRYPLKRANDECQTLLEKWVEPLAAIAALAGFPVQPSYVELAYNYLLMNHAHDSICGCSIDQVHKDMEYRFSQVKEISHQIMGDIEAKERSFRLAAKQAAQVAYADVNQVPSAAIAEAGAGHNLMLSLWNPLSFERTEVITVDIDFPLNYPCQYQEPFGYEEKNSFKILDHQGNEVPYGLVSMHKQHTVRNFGQLSRKVDRHRVSFMADMPAMGTVEYKIVPFDRASRYLSALSRHPREAENEYIKLFIRDNGTLNIHDKRSGKTYDGLCSYMDDGEIGDGWYHANPAEDRLVNSHGAVYSIERIENGPSRSVFRVTHHMKVPKRIDWSTQGIRRSDDYTVLKIVSLIGLSQGSPAVDVETTIENTAEDHRLRLELPTGLDSPSYYVNQPFAIVERHAGVRMDTQDWKECDVPEKQTGGIVAKRAQDGTGLAFISAFGIHECAGMDDDAGTLAVTLFRSTRRTVLTNGEEGGQLLGPLHFKYQLSLLDASTSYADLIRLQDKLQAGIHSTSYPAAEHNEPLGSNSYFQLTGSDICLSLLKRPQSGLSDSVIIRVYNVSASASTGDIDCFRNIISVKEVNLLEEEIGGVEEKGQNGQNSPIEFHTSGFSFHMEPWKFKTFMVSFENWSTD
jgi:mannosylglycerate hydrolase